MEYQALYRRYRPQTFDDVIGQGHVTSTLAREVAEGHVAHAYLFAGPRGTGKTTTARILAKALNCENRATDGSPDNTCQSCLAITEGSSLDVMELDAASHNSVDDIRDMRVSVSTVASSVTGRRVFILDEAHMLSKAAGNALLKTLEEPPPGVHFVLATTEPYKLLDTIRSRAQRFDFHAISIETLAAHLGRIGDDEGLKTEPSALVAVARHARGSARDALSLLEQVSALGNGTVDMKGVLRALGLADADAYTTLTNAIVDGDAKSALELVARLASEGADLRRFIAEAVAFLRGVFLAHYAPNLAEITDEPDEVVAAWRQAAKSMSPGEVLRAVDLLGDALIKLREGREERLMLELAVIKLTRPETTTDNEALTARLDRIERRLASTPMKEDRPVDPPRLVEPSPITVGSNEPSTPEAGPTADSVNRPDLRLVGPDDAGSSDAGSSDAGSSDPGRAFSSPGASDQQIDQLPPGEPEAPSGQTGSGPATEPTGSGATGFVTMEQFESIWPQLFEGLRDLLGSRRWALFRETRAGAVEGDLLLVDVRYDFHLKALQDDGVVSKVVATRAGDLLGTPVRVGFRLVGEDGKTTTSAHATGAAQDRPADDRPAEDPHDSGSQAPETGETENETGETDADRLLEAPPDVANALSLVTSELGGEVIEEYEEED